MGGVGRGHSQAGAWLWELEESQQLGKRTAVSGVLSYRGTRSEVEGETGKGPGEFQREKEGYPRPFLQRLWSPFSLMQPHPSPRLTPRGVQEAAGPPKSGRRDSHLGLSSHDLG